NGYDDNEEVCHGTLQWLWATRRRAARSPAIPLRVLMWWKIGNRRGAVAPGFTDCSYSRVRCRTWGVGAMPEMGTAQSRHALAAGPKMDVNGRRPTPAPSPAGRCPRTIRRPMS